MSDLLWSWDIYKIKEGDPASTQLTFDPNNDWIPRSAPGGGRAGFVSDRDGDREIYVIDFDGTDERQLTHNDDEDLYPSWSPSGTRIVYSSDQDGDHEIYVRDVDGSYWTQLTYNSDWDSEPAYSPDGSKIVFTKGVPPYDVGDYSIWIMNADSSGQKPLFAKPAGVDDFYPAWSPDGKWIAFTRYDPVTGINEIHVYSFATGATPLLTPSQNDWAPVWAPDGQWIAFSSDGRTGFGDEEVWVIPVANGAAAGLAINISEDPTANDRYPDFLWPRMPAQNGSWEQASTWMPSGVPGQRDRVLIRNLDTVTLTSSAQKVIRQLQVDGNLSGRCAVRVSASGGITVTSTGWIAAGRHGFLKTGCKVALNAWPNGTITVRDDGTVLGGDGAGLQNSNPAWAENGGPVELLAKNVVIDGDVWGGDGGDLGRNWRDRAGQGGSVTVAGEYITIDSGARVWGGDGGDTNPGFTSPRNTSDCPTHWQHGGDGGSVSLGSGSLVSYGGTRQLTVCSLGSVAGGDGGDVTGAHPGRTGSGGDVVLSVQLGTWGVLEVEAGASVAGGNGGMLTGDCTVPGLPNCCVCGGNGGDVFKFASLSISMAGSLLGGNEGEGRAVPECACNCSDGFQGNLTNHPPSITFASTAQESGRNVWIYGGEGWGIDLSQVSPGAIAATESITVAVGSGGQIDLRGHGAGENVLSAGQSIFLYADQIQLDPGVSVSDVTSPTAQTAPARVIHRGLLHAEGGSTALANETAIITLTVTNAGSGADTFQLTTTDTEGWAWQLSPASLSLEAMAEGVAVATAVVPPEAVGLLNDVTFNARSTADPSQTAVVHLSLRTVELSKTYLPLLLRDYTL